MSEPFLVEVDAEGCSDCGARRTEDALRDLVEVSEIAVGLGITIYRPDMNGPLPRARALLAKLADAAT